MEFKWSVNKVTVAEDNLVVKVHCTITATDGDNTASAAYICDLIRGDKFVPYAQLTEQQVLAWCFEPKTFEYDSYDWTTNKPVKKSGVTLIKDEGEAQVAEQIARQLAQKAAEPALPWL